MGSQHSSLMFENKIAVVIGAHTPFGQAAVMVLAQQGAHVIASARYGSDIAQLIQNVRNHNGIISIAPQYKVQNTCYQTLASMVFEKFGHADIVLSAHVMFGVPSMVSRVDTNDWKRSIEVNLTINHQIIRAFDTLLHRAEAGRALFTTASVSRNVRPMYGVFDTTKAALEKLIQAYAAECAVSNVRVNLIDPGLLRGTMRGETWIDECTPNQKQLNDAAYAMLRFCTADCQKNGETIYLPDLGLPKNLTIFGDPIIDQSSLGEAA